MKGATYINIDDKGEVKLLAYYILRSHVPSPNTSYSYPSKVMSRPHFSHIQYLPRRVELLWVMTQLLKWTLNTKPHDR
jgi:hypothetical protein